MSYTDNWVDTLLKQEPVYLFQNGEEFIAEYAGTLIGTIKGKHFGCSYKLLPPIMSLFFNEAKDQKTLSNSKKSAMSTERIPEFLDTIIEKLGQNPHTHSAMLQMMRVRDLWQKDQNNIKRALKTKSDREKEKRLAEALLAKKRREENQAKTEQLKATRIEARTKRKEQITKPSSCDQESPLLNVTHKIIPQTGKKESVPPIQALIHLHPMEEKKDRDNQSPKSLSCEKTKENTPMGLLKVIAAQTDICPIFEYDKDGNPCFYGKMKGDVIHIIFSISKPRCQIISHKKAKPLNVQQYSAFMQRIDDSLNKTGQLDTILEKMGLIYHAFESKNRPITADKDAEKLYILICQKLMTPRVIEPHKDAAMQFYQRHKIKS